MYARIICGRVAALTAEFPYLGPNECAHIVRVSDLGIRVGWEWAPEGCAPPSEPAPNPLAVAHSYMLADAQTVDDLRDAVATVFGVVFE